MIDLAKRTIDQEIELLREIAVFSKRIENASPSERVMLSDGINSLREIMKKTSDRIIEILNGISRSGNKKEREIAESKIAPENSMPKFRERDKYIAELEIDENILNRLKGKKIVAEEAKEIGFRKARGYLRYANKFFIRSASRLIKKGYFSSLPTDI